MFSRFFVLLILYVVIMIVGTLHLEQDDTRLTGVHIRTLISALQVWIVGVLMSLYIMFKFFIHVVKTDRTSFVLVSVAQPAQQPQETSVREEETKTSGPTIDENESVCMSVSSDHLPLNIVFEASQNLDFYVLYVNFVGLILWSSFICFNFATYDSVFIFMNGIVMGWILNTISKECHCHESKTPPIQGEKLRVLCCIGLSLLIMSMGAVNWQVPTDIEFFDALNLYIPAFFSGFFWTAIGHEVAFTGVQNLHVTKGILYDARRSLPTFYLVVTVSALCSSPETRITVIDHIYTLSRLALVHMLLIEPLLIFVSVYVMVIALERQRAADFSIVMVLVGGFYLAYRRQTYDNIFITTITASVLLFSMHASYLLRRR